MHKSLFFGCAIVGIKSVNAALVQNGFSVTLGEIDYYIPSFAQATVESPDIQGLPAVLGLTPVTVVSDSIDQEDLVDLFANWAIVDDVWQPDFLSTVFLDTNTTSPCRTRRTFFGNTSSIIVPLAGSVPSGPYFLEISSGSLFAAYRLYNDYAGAFTQGLIQSPDQTFKPLSARITGTDSQTIGVPSRLGFQKTPKKPLAGVRVGVKDIYDLAGVKKSNGNRGWWNLYPAANVTAVVIQNLIDAGAIVVGYQKTSQFANAEAPTADWVDYHAPFNPRGDGYNDASSSSAGAGSSMGSYQWLDVAVGSDTGGSVRLPANAQGLFGNRPSHGLVSLNGVMPMAPSFDTAGFLIRDPDLWDVINQVAYGENYTAVEVPEYPTQIFTLASDWPAANTSAGALQNEFARSLAAFIGANLNSFDVYDAWAESAPVEAEGANLHELLAEAYAMIVGTEQTREVRDPFYEDYAAAHEGRTPFVNPVPLARWSWSDNRPESWYPESLDNKTIFMDWFNKDVLPPVGNPAQCSSKLFLYTGASAVPTPRNRYPDAPIVPLSFAVSRIPVFGEVPDSVFPIGEVPVMSSITGQEELLPVTVNVMAAKGCDGLLAKLARDLVEAGILTVPQAGKTLDGGDVLMRRGE